MAAQPKTIKWSRAGEIRELPVSDDGEFVLLGTLKIPYFTEFSMDDFMYEPKIAPSNKEAAEIAKKDTEAINKVIEMGFCTQQKRQELEQQICHDYAMVVKCIRQGMKSTEADNAIAHLKSLRSSFVQKLGLFFDALLADTVTIQDSEKQKGRIESQLEENQRVVAESWCTDVIKACDDVIDALDALDSDSEPESSDTFEIPTMDVADVPKEAWL